VFSDIAVILEAQQLRINIIFSMISAWGQAEAKGGRNVRTPCLGRLLHGPWAVKGEGFAEDYKGNRDGSGEDINYQKENMFIFLLKSLPPLLFFV